MKIRKMWVARVIPQLVSDKRTIYRYENCMKIRKQKGKWHNGVFCLLNMGTTPFLSSWVWNREKGNICPCILPQKLERVGKLGREGQSNSWSTRQGPTQHRAPSDAGGSQGCGLHESPPIHHLLPTPWTNSCSLGLFIDSTAPVPGAAPSPSICPAPNKSPWATNFQVHFIFLIREMPLFMK